MKNVTGNLQRPTGIQQSNLWLMLALSFVVSDAHFGFAQEPATEQPITRPTPTPAKSGKKPTGDRETSDEKKTPVDVLGQSLTKDVPAAGTSDAAILKEVQQRIERLQGELHRLRKIRNAPAPAFTNTPDQPWQWLVDVAQFGQYYNEKTSANERFLILRLVLLNHSDSAMTIAPEQLSLSLENNEVKWRPVADRVKNHSINLLNPNGNQRGLSISQLDVGKPMKIPSKECAATWMVVSDLAEAGASTKVKVTLNLDGKSHELDVSEQQLAALGLEVERIGPKGCLALMTIHGSLTSFTAFHLAEALDRLNEQKVARCVLRWSDSAPGIDHNLQQWLAQSITNPASRNHNNWPQFPTFPSSIREMHLEEFAKKNGRSTNEFRNYDNGNGGTARIHANTLDAVAAATRTAFEVLPADTLLEEIRTGHPLIRATALAYGAPRLDSSQLPMVLELSKSSDSTIQRGAIMALAQFNDAEAIHRLIEVANSDSPAMKNAIESLAVSRFAEPQEALLALYPKATPPVKQAILAAFGRFPRSLWSDLLYAATEDSSEPIKTEAMKSLVKVGHPRLVDVLARGLKEADATVRILAFAELSKRGDERSESLALEFALKQLATTPPDSNVTNFLTRVKDPRAIPLLLKHLENKQHVNSVLNLLAVMGDSGTAKRITELYPNFSVNDKAGALNALRRLKSPEYLRLSADAILSKEHHLVYTACQNLQQDGSPEAAPILIRALEKQTDDNCLTQIIYALGNIATFDARKALLKLKDSKSANVKNAVQNALQNMRHRSPGYQYIYQGQQSYQQRKWKEAIEAYDMALQIDPDLAEAHAGLGLTRIRQEKYTEAAADFENALKLDLETSQVITGAGICRAFIGKVDEGIQLVEKHRPQFANDAEYAYNTGCVYGRAHENTEKQPAGEARDNKLAEYRQKALADLKSSIDRGYADFEWMRKDPDFGSLRKDPEYRQLVRFPDAEKK